MTPRIEKTVFISYRRTNLPWALCIYQNLTMHGYDVFFDYQSIDSGNFEKVILENIKARAHFLVILTPSALERCNEPGDWLRREIETAMDEKRNIVPLMLESFDFGSPLVKNALTGKLASINKFNGLRVYSEYFFEAMDKLRERYLNVAVSDIALPSLNPKAKEITETQKTAASEAPQVEKDQLTAQEWAERGYVFWESSNYDEAIRCYSEALKLEPNEVFSYGIRGVVYIVKGELEKGFADLGEAIRLKPDFVDVYVSRGLARKNIGDIQGAIEDYTEAIRIKPDYADALYNRGIAFATIGENQQAVLDMQEASELMPERGSVRASLAKTLKLLGRKQEAKKHEKIARDLIQNEGEYDQACFEAIFGNTDKALSLLRIWLEKRPHDKAWAQQDPDFESIRDDPRFNELVGE